MPKERNMKPTFVEAFKVRGYSAEDYERDFPELSAVAHEWANFLVSQHGKSFFSEEFLNLESKFKAGPVCCRIYGSELVHVEEAFAYTLYNEWLLNGKEFKDFVSHTDSLKYETPALRLADPDFYTFEQKMEAEDTLRYGYYARHK